MALLPMRALQRLRNLRNKLSALPSSSSASSTSSSSSSGKISNARLLLINTGTCCFLYSMGDFCRQRIEGNTTDWHRTGRMGVLGCCLGPLDHFWYTALDRLLPAITAGTVARKVLLDQLIMAPICCSLFYLGMSAMEGRSRKDCFNELQVKFWPTYKVDWQVWPAAQILNFYLIPPHFRVAYVASITFLWTVYLSYMKHKKMSKTDSMLIH
ncbi:PREDICTED: mpv17-like protein 2 [Amphimedon queenslandica]|uniref:Mpv17-like protein 2 n=1 Tax=Amphimedon queenslandica TaxID=400682 RepID=A0A1X7UGI6_AMPQE|nr:PREDICTED: mpv17-like protein 2 [Amphimedon queenslandica]|eukprot:XP_011405251.1 PREDICTED: mpv17-like protein 2 [Amphimedon queenslandica]